MVTYYRTINTEDRRQIILQRLQEEGEVAFGELAQGLGTSEMTIRRDLELLEIEGIARRVRGGAIAVRSRSYEPPILQRSSHEAGAKKRIGQAAAALLEDGESTILDVGTTVLEMAKAISPSLSLTVITSSLLIATELAGKPLANVIVTGGVVRHGEMSLIGPQAEESFAGFNCDSIFLGVAGVSETKGLSEYNLDDARVKRAAMNAARRVVVLADASKIGQLAFANVALLSEIDLLITNASPDHRSVRAIKEQGVEVLHVEPSKEERD
jgi:DeoR family transcriptional regulator of aga operon